MNLYSTDEIILQAIKEKKQFESHPEDICYACHHKKVWKLVRANNEYDDKTMTLTELKTKLTDIDIRI